MINVENPIYKINNEEVNKEQFYNRLELARHTAQPCKDDEYCFNVSKDDADNYLNENG